MKDVLPEIRQDYPGFSDFTISGTSISPAPDVFDKRLIALKTALSILCEDQVEASGDAILIKKGSITLDTSRNAKLYEMAIEKTEKAYDKLTKSLNKNGKTGTDTSIGFLIDNYKSETTDVKDPHSLI